MPAATAVGKVLLFGAAIPFRIIVDGLVYERVTERGVFVTENGAPVYARVVI